MMSNFAGRIRLSLTAGEASEAFGASGTFLGLDIIFGLKERRTFRPHDGSRLFRVYANSAIRLLVRSISPSFTVTVSPRPRTHPSPPPWPHREPQLTHPRPPPRHRGQTDKMAFTMHSHSGQFCPGHAKDQLEDIIERAIALGFTTMGLTEHMPRYNLEDLYPEEVYYPPRLSSHPSPGRPPSHCPDHN